MMDPVAKLARNEARRIKDAERRGKRVKPKRRGRKRGHLASSEKLIIAEIVKDAPAGIVAPDVIASTALVLRRSPDAITSAIARARETFQSHAQRYAEIHLTATEQAIATNDNDTARKSAQWAMENLSAKNAAGQHERIIDKADQSSQQPVINIGIALGGMPSRDRT